MVSAMVTTAVTVQPRIRVSPPLETVINQRLAKLSELGFEKISYSLYRMYTSEELNVEEISELLDDLLILSATQVIAIKNRDSNNAFVEYSEVAIGCLLNLARHLDEYSQIALYFTSDLQLLDIALFADRSSTVRLAEKIIGGGIGCSASQVVLVLRRYQVPNPNGEDSFLVNQIARGLSAVNIGLLDDIVAGDDMVYSNTSGRIFHSHAESYA